MPVNKQKNKLLMNLQVLNKILMINNNKTKKIMNNYNKNKNSSIKFI